jgi:hypothetical protein
MLEPKTETFPKTENYLTSPQAKRALSRALLAAGVFAATVCTLLWVWVDDTRWGPTGLILFVAFAIAALFVAPHQD